MAAGLLLVAAVAATFGYGYLRGRWRALAEVVGLALLVLLAEVAFVAAAPPLSDDRVVSPGMALFLVLSVALPLVAGGIVTRQARRSAA